MKMPAENINTIMFAPCGINCKVCYKHCYHKKPCARCLNSDRGKLEHCRKCKIKDCIKDKGLSYCFECSIVKETIGVGVNEKAALSLKKLPFRLHQFRFFLGEQSRVPLANNYGDLIFALLISLVHHLCYE